MKHKTINYLGRRKKGIYWCRKLISVMKCNWNKSLCGMSQAVMVNKLVSLCGLVFYVSMWRNVAAAHLFSVIIQMSQKPHEFCIISQYQMKLCTYMYSYFYYAIHELGFSRFNCSSNYSSGHAYTQTYRLAHYRICQTNIVICCV